jgi:hypothetical protein
MLSDPNQPHITVFCKSLVIPNLMLVPWMMHPYGWSKISCSNSPSSSWCAISRPKSITWSLQYTNFEVWHQKHHPQHQSIWTFALSWHVHHPTRIVSFKKKRKLLPNVSICLESKANSSMHFLSPLSQDSN